MITDNFLLTAFAKILNKQTNYDEILRIIAAKVNEILKADNTLIMMINPSTHETIKTVLRDEKGTNERMDLAQRMIVGWMINKDEPFFSKDITTDQRFSNIKKSKLKKLSVVASILEVENIHFGAILAFREEKSKAFDKQNLEILEYLTVVSAPYLRNIKKIKEYFLPEISPNALLHKYAEVGLIGESAKFIELLSAIDTAARSGVRVVLEGESGTGKELIARAIHRFSNRNEKPYIAIDCGTLPSHLIESELFGHKKGAFTGATFNRKGLIEEAHEGILFIDEIASLPLELQSKFMRFLQEGEIRPLGSNESKKVDVRIISASSSSLSVLVEKGKFRQDLYFRLLVYPIYIPNLRERKEDIQILTDFFLKKFAEQQDKKLESLNRRLLNFLEKHSWNGNIRELQNLIERLVALADPDKLVLKYEELPPDIIEESYQVSGFNQSGKKTLKDQLLLAERQIINNALSENNWNQSAAARELNISESMIRYRMKKVGLK